MTLRAMVWLLCFVAGFSHAEGITDKQVHEVLAEVDRAINALDAEGIGSVMVPDARIIMHLKAGGYRETMTVNTRRYVEILKDAWANYEHYAYVRESVEIIIDEGGQEALVKATVFETMVVKGETTEGISREEMVFRNVDGKLLITGVESWTAL